MTRFMIRASDADQFQRAKALVDGRVRVFVASERRMFLSTADLSPELQDELREAGARVSVEKPLYSVETPA